MILLLLASAITAPTQHQTVQVDHIEYNHAHSANGQPTINQLILKRWGRHNGKPGYQISEWMLMQREPLVIRRGRLWIVRLRDYDLVTHSYRETYTTYDPELHDRNRLPESDRVPYLTRDDE